MKSRLLRWTISCSIFACGLLGTDLAWADDVPSFTVEVQGQGRPMLLIPGLGCGRDVWAETIDAFDDRYEIHLVQLAGFAGQPAVEGAFLPQVRQDLAAYIRQQGLHQPVIVGHSLGGFLAFWLAASEPELIGAIVAVDGVPFLPALMQSGATEASARHGAESLRTMMATLDAQQYAVQNRMALDRMITDPVDVGRIAETSRTSDPRAVGQAVYELMTTDLRDQMVEVDAPVLLIAAAAGATTGDALDRLRRNYEIQIQDVDQGEVVVAPTRHFVMLDDFDFLKAAMQTFLDQDGDTTSQGASE